jgi:hypothetical protein
MLTLGSLTLDPSPFVSSSYEYKLLNNGRVVGVVKKLTLSGSIIKESASDVLIEAKKINEWFGLQANRYINNVTINGQVYNFIIIDSVSIDSSDWVNKLTYSIKLTAPPESTLVIPSNVLNLSYNDFIEQIDINETLELESDKQGTYYIAANGFKTVNGTVKWSCKIGVTCRRSSTNSAIKNAENVLRRIILTTPDRKEFDEYKLWNKFLQTRSINMNASNGSIDFDCSIVMIPDTIINNCLVSFNESNSHNYVENSHTKSFNMEIEGLVPINWSDIINISSSCLPGKYDAAYQFANSIVGAYRSPDSYQSLDLILQKLNCPIFCNTSTDAFCYSPRNSTITHSIIDGSVGLNFEWGSDRNNCNNNGISVEIEETMASYNQSIKEFTSWAMPYTIIQNLNCTRALIKSFQISAQSSYQCPNSLVRSEATNAASNVYNLLPSEGEWFLVKHTSSETNTSYTINMDFVRVCP